MARKRYISTDLSKSGKMEELARRVGEFGPLLFTWMIPHLDDWGRMEGSADKVFFEVLPRFAMLERGPDDAEAALREMADLGLIQRYRVGEDIYVQANLDTFYELQTYIPHAKREEDHSKIPPPSNGVALSSTESREVAQNTPSPFTLLPSPSPSPTNQGTNGTERASEDLDTSDEPDASPDESLGQSVSPGDDWTFDDLMEFYHRRIGMIGPSQFSKVQGWQEEHGMSPGLIARAVQILTEARRTGRIRGDPFAYLQGILRNWHNDGTRTVAGLEAARGPETEEEYVAAILAKAAEGADDP